jgi:Domain of unknown function (DUF1841)
MTSAGSPEDPRIGGYTRDELRRSYADAWRKHLSRVPMTPLEVLIAEVIALHPEYHAVVGAAAQAIGHESPGDDPRENPFLHMGLHIAVREQLAVDRPPGIRELKRALEAQLDDRHAAEHALMEALAETLWEAQRNGRQPDERHYLEIARRALRRPTGH